MVYDSTSSESFDSLGYWVKELENRSEKNVLINVVASKIDDDVREEVHLKTAAEYAKKIGAQFHQTSAKDGTGIEKLFTDTANTLSTRLLAGETPDLTQVRARAETTTLRPEMHVKKSEGGEYEMDNKASGKKKGGCC